MACSAPYVLTQSAPTISCDKTHAIRAHPTSTHR